MQGERKEGRNKGQKDRRREEQWTERGKKGKNKTGKKKIVIGWRDSKTA